MIRLLLICSLFFLSPLFSAEVPLPPELIHRLETYIKVDETENKTIGYLSIDDRSQGISESTWLYVKKALDYYKSHPPLFIILNLNTPGGEVFASQKISDALKEFDTQYNIPVVAYINNWAISAGAMLAYSCRFITVVKDASMGAAEPVLATETGEMKTASEKVNSALRSDFANRASYFNRNPYIAEAMVDKESILVQRDGKIIKLDLESQIKTAEPNPDLLISPKGKLLTLTGEELLKYGVADLMIPPTKVAPITEEEKEKGKWPANKMALFHTPFFDKMVNYEIDAYQMDWKTQFFALLATPAVSSLLLLGLMVGFYVEITTPGFGLPGTIALISLFFIILSYLSLEIANWLEVILLLTGLTILIIELFLLPTFGLLGFFGILLFAAGLFGILLPGIEHFSFDYTTHTLNAAGEEVLMRLSWFLGTITLAIIIIALLARYLTPKLATWSKLVLVGDEQEGYKASKYDSSAIGMTAIVVADLKPAGYIEIDGKREQAISISGYIGAGNKVIVVGGEEDSLIVKLNKEETS